MSIFIDRRKDDIMDELLNDIKMHSAYLSDNFDINNRLSISIESCINIMVSKNLGNLDYQSKIQYETFTWKDIKDDIIPLYDFLERKYGVKKFMIDFNSLDSIESIDDDLKMRGFIIAVNINKNDRC